jgi:hypothetical protein
MYIKKLIILASLLFSSLSFASHPITGAPITKVHALIWNVNEGKPATEANFYLNVYLNDEKNAVVSFVISPGALELNPVQGKEAELTPEGVYHPTRINKDYVSKQHGGRILGIFETGGMPNSVFFYRGFAIHGSLKTVNGMPASKGCVRLKMRDSKRFFEWVSEATKNGTEMQNVIIDVRDTEAPEIRAYKI